MKKKMRLSAVIPVLFISLLAISSCETYMEDIPGTLPVSGNRVSQTGGIIRALNNNVVLMFPEGAVIEPVMFSVNEVWDEFDRNYVMQMVSIEPTIAFANPVMLTLKYDSDPAIHKTIPAGLNLVVHYWDTYESYLNQDLVKQLPCSLDTDAGTITAWITQSGVYAVVIDSKDPAS